METLCFIVLYLLIAGITKNVLKHLYYDVDDIGDFIVSLVWPILLVVLLSKIVYYLITKSSWVDKIGKYIATHIEKLNK